VVEEVQVLKDKTINLIIHLIGIVETVVMDSHHQ
jgi:hypothetical protein